MKNRKPKTQETKSGEYIIYNPLGALKEAAKLIKDESRSNRQQQTSKS